MRILHTSDWHLGRSFHGVDLLPAQAAHLDHLVETVRSEGVDLVVVSGDVYDRALPPVGAVELASDVLGRLAAMRVRVVVTSGNHDSAIRLGSNARLVDAAGVHLRTRWQDVGTPVLVEDAWGPVAVHGLPYLEPDAVRQAWGLAERTHAAALEAAMSRVHADLDRRGGRSVVMAHAFVAGSAEAGATMRSDSERELAVGGLAVVPTSLFTRASYAALGHLHGSRELTSTVRYSGSPVAYSFSEESQTKGSWLVELGRDGVERVDLVPAPVHRGLRRVRGRLEDLLSEPALARRGGALPRRDAHRPRPAGGPARAAADALPAHPDARVRPRGRRRGPPSRRPPRDRTVRPRRRAGLRPGRPRPRGDHRGGAPPPAGLLLRAA